MANVVNTWMSVFAVALMTGELALAAPLSPESALLKIAARHERELLSPEWLSDSRQIVIDELDVSPGSEERLSLLDVSTGTKRPFAKGRWPAPAPSGLLIAYLTSDGKIEVRDAGSQQLACQSSVDPGYELATNWGEGPVLGWSADARRLIYVLSPVSDTEGHPPYQVVALDVVSGRRTVLFDQTNPIISAQWAGTDALIEVSSPLWTDGEVMVVRDGRIHPLIRGEGQQFLMPRVGPGGRIAFLQDTLKQTVVGSKNLAIFDPERGSVQVLTSDIFVSWSPPRWAGPQRLLALCKRGPFTSTFCSEGATSTRIELDPLESVTHWSVSPDGKLMAWRSNCDNGTRNLWVAGTDGAGRKLLETNPEPLAGSFKLGEAKPFHWRSDDGLQLAGLLVLPKKSQQPMPLIVDLHGGPMGGLGMEGQILNSTPLEWHYWTQRGYAVFVADYRSSLLYGSDVYLKMRARGDFYTDDMRDVLSGVDAVIKAANIDPHRIAIIGHSAGAGLTNYIITRTSRFKVAVTKEGSADWITAYTDNDDAGRRYQHWRFEGSPESARGRYEQNSPAYRAKQVRTPVYVMAASCCAGQDLEIFARKIKEGGGEVKYRMFDDAHVFGKPENQRDALYESVQWIAHHLDVTGDGSHHKQR